MSKSMQPANPTRQPQTPAVRSAEVVQAPVRRVQGALGRPSSPAGSRNNPPGTVNIVALLYQGLRGRIALAVILGILVGGGCAVLGWRSAQPVYHSESLLRIAYSLPKVFQETDQNAPMGQMFDTFMQSQQLLITSRRVIDMALQDPVWKASGRQVPTNPDEFFADNMDVIIQPRSEYILISVSDPDPGTAAAAVTSIANAYAELFHTQEKQLERQRTGVLEERQAFLQGRLDELNKQVHGIATKYGTTALDALHDAAMVRVNRFDTALGDVRMAMLTASPDAPDVDNGNGAAEGLAVQLPATQPTTQTRTPEEIALTDPVMRSYLTDQENLQRELSRLSSYGAGPLHPDIVATRQALQDAQARIRRYAELPRSPGVAAGSPAVAQALGDPRGAMVVTAGRSIELLRKDETTIRGLLKEAKQELSAIGIDRLSLRQLEAELATFRLEQDQVGRRVSGLRAEAALGGRLNIISTGEIALVPDRDPRRKLAAMAALTGAGIPAGLLVLLGILRPRYRYHDETEADMAGRVPLLGILPALSESDEPSGHAMSHVAHCIHQMRVTLRAQAPRDGCNSYLVTSATSGEGKTSLVMSLGLSFSASHLRTLVVDGDLVSRELTRGLQAQGVQGLNEALAAGTLRRMVRKMRSGVYVLCAGQASGVDACGLSPAAVRSLFHEAKRHFDVILIDSGPIMGSVEAAVFAPEVDGVIFTITRGQQRGAVQQAQRRLELLGATLAGVVFNRAQPKDFRSSPFGSSSYSSPDNEPELKPVSLPEADQQLLRFGPLVRAVVSGIPHVAA